MSARDWTEHDPTERHDERSGEAGDDAVGRDRIEYRPNRDERGKWLSAAVALLGLAAIAGAGLIDVGPARFWNDLFVGVALLAVGGYNYRRRSNEGFGSVGAALLAAGVGLWFAASPLLVGTGGGSGSSSTAGSAGGGSPGLAVLPGEVGTWLPVVVGLLAFVIATGSASLIRRGRRAADARATKTYDRRGQ